jgi:hypothetical protein
MVRDSNFELKPALLILLLFYLLLSRVESRGNPSLPERMLALYPPDGVSHLGGCMHLTM